MNPRALIAALLIGGVGAAVAHYAPALPDSRIAAPSRQFGLPFAGKPGVNSWLLGQLYGNTTGAYRRRGSDYRAGQGIHFGMDFSAPCGTPVIAIGDGVVSEVDGPHGSPPHNLVINHTGNLSSLYGHLRTRSSLRVGQRVNQGDVIGVSGDSQFTCISAPHLHLELRDSSHQRFFNPVGYINADWDSLALIGGFGRGYQRDLSNPRRWQSLSDQPQARRGGAALNNYAQPWPPVANDRALSYPARLRVAPAAPRATSVQTTQGDDLETGVARPLTSGACCVSPLWSADSSRVYFIDKPSGAAQSAIYGVSAINPSGVRMEFGSVAQFSPSRRFAVLPGASTILERLSDGQRVRVPAQANISFSKSESKIAWSVTRQIGTFDAQATRVYTANLTSGSRLLLSAPKLIATLYGGGLSGWLNESELLLTGKSSPLERDRALRIVNAGTGAGRVISSALSQRGVNISPGGRWVAYYVAFDSASRNGMFVLDTKSGVSKRVDWFGSYRWRDANRIVYIPLETGVPQHRVLEWNASTGAKRELAKLGARVAGDDWQLAPNGQRIAFVSAANRNLYVLELPK